MNSFELNKIIGAILGTLLFVMGVGLVAEAVYEPREAGPGLTLPEPEGTEHAAGEEEAPPAQPIAVLLASADVTAGENAAKKCQSCHNFAQGAGNKTGPELYDVVERVIGSHPGFAYSPVMQEHAAAGDTWTYDALNAFLLAPKEDMPGTKMNFSGLKNDAERANVIAYLATLSAAPKPFPPVEAAAPVTEGTEAVPTEAGATPTPTETQSETSVQGTATTSGTEPAPPATDAAPAPATEGSTPAPAAPAAGH